ncbi:MAG: hypothetical protein LBK95_19440 [Bifidobacteriaceae bacterium]|jgi:hypothetical protein|nr:hypothetical protein [Bifidobacteriaceae bacterium]
MTDTASLPRRPRQAGFRASEAVAAATLLVLAAVPLGAAIWIASLDDPLSQAANAVEAVYGYPDATTLAGKTEAVLALEWAPGPDVVAPSWQGTITALEVDPGDTLTNGQAVLRVDGLPRLGLVTGQPFWRSLGPDDTGADVRMLHDALASLGISAGAGEAWSAATTRGVRELQTDRLGIRKEGLVDGFDPSWVVWLPEADLRVGTIEAAIGSPAPAAGEPVLTGEQVLISAGLQDLQGNALFLDAGQVWVFETADWEGDLDAEAGAMLPEDLELFRQQVAPGTESALGSVRYREPRDVTSVPTTAVLSQGGATCVWVESSSGPRGQPEATPVEVISGDATATFLATPLDARTRVLVNPAALPHLPSCV